MDLLFAHEDGDQLLAERPDSSSAAGEAQQVKVQESTRLADITAAASDLAAQRWALVVPEGAWGDRLAALMKPLVAKRAEDQQAEVLTVRVPPGMDAEAAECWKRDVFPALHGHSERRRPRYLLILGDMDQVSLATQQELALDGLPGRLVCAAEAGYEAYASKVLAAEQQPSAHDTPRARFYTVHDGTSATSTGYTNLVQPCFGKCHKDWREQRATFPASDVVDCGNTDEADPDEFSALVRSAHPTVLLSLSHGLGPPRRRKWTRAEARERQGAMQFGAAGSLLPEHVATGSFLPRGLWFYFACFGAGTPDHSAYHHWLGMLEENGMQGLGSLRAVLKGLARDGGFTSGLAQAALANPEGPLAMVGHVDLAWSYSYEELRDTGGGRIRGTNRVQNFANFLAKLVKGERAGAAFLELQRMLIPVSGAINRHYDQARQGAANVEGASPEARRTLGHLWMARQDLRGYVLLGDPAVRLPLAPPPPKPSGANLRASFFAGMGLPAEFTAERAEAERAAAERADRVRERVEQVEQAILAPAAEGIDAVARTLAASHSEAQRLHQVYCEAGRKALAEALREHGEDT